MFLFLLSLKEILEILPRAIYLSISQVPVSVVTNFLNLANYVTLIDASASTLLQTESGKRLFGSVLTKLTDLLEDQESMLSVLGQLEILQ